MNARAAVALTLLGLVARASPAALGPRYGGELTVAVLEMPASTKPAVTAGAGGRLLGGLVHETLVGVGPEGLPLPALAQQWASGAGGRECTLTLAESLRFHDDRTVTAADAVRSLRRFLRGGGAAARDLAESLEGGLAYAAGATDELPGLSTTDSRHLIMRMREPRALPLSPLSSPAAAVTSPGGAGCGPFVPTLFLPGRRVALTAFAGHRRGRPYLDRIQVEAVPEPSALRADVQASRIDVAPGKPGVSTVAATLLLTLDSSRTPFDHAAARATVAAAVNRRDLVKNLIPGGDPAPSLLVPALLPPLGVEPSAPPAVLTGRVQMAVDMDVPPLLSQRVVAHLGALGFDVRVLPVSPANVGGLPAHARLRLFSPTVPEARLALLELADEAPPVPAALQALAEAAREPDADRRRLDVLRAEGALRAEAVLIPLASVPVSFGGRSRVHGARVDLTGRLVLEDAWAEP